MVYRITVRPITSERWITFTKVESYKVIDGFVTFKDTFTGTVCRYAVCNTEISEVNE